MPEKELIKKLKEFKKIKPNKDWVFSLKYEILKESPNLVDYFNLRPILLKASFLILALFLISQILIPSPVPQPVYQSKKENNLDKLQAKLIDLKKSALKGENKEKLQREIEEYKNVASKMAQEIKNKEKLENKKIEKFVVAQMEVRKTLHSLNDDLLKDFQNEASCVLAEKMLKDLESRSLNEKQKLYFQASQEFLQEGNCVDALTNIWYLGYIK